MNQVLPIDKEMENEDVYQYLLSVRKESEMGSSIAYLPRSLEISRPVVDPVFKPTPFSNNLIQEFLKLKEQVSEEYKELNQVSKSFHSFRENFNTDPPSMDYFFQLKRIEVFKIITFAMRQLNLNASETLSKWIWRLFLRIDSVLEASECSLIRDLAKKAIALKAKQIDTNVSSISRYTMEMIVIIVGRYYGQQDLLLM